MAELQHNKILSVDGEWQEFTDSYGGNSRQAWATFVTIEGRKGPVKIALQTSSAKLRDLIQPGVTLAMTCIGKTADDARWKFKSLGRDNPELVDPQGQYSGSGHAPQGAQARSGLSEAPRIAYHTPPTLGTLTALYSACYEDAEKVVGDVPADALVAATATLFIQACRDGVRVENQGATESAPPAEQEPFGGPDGPPPSGDSDSGLPF